MALSGQPDNSAQWETARSLGINATMNLRGESPDNETYLNSIGIEYYHLPIINNGATGSWSLIEEQDEVAINWINSKLAEGKKVLIHCHLGQNRAPTMAMLWYIHEAHTAEEAYAWVLQYPVSNPFDYQKQRAVDYYYWLQLQPTPMSTPSSGATATSTASPTPSPEQKELGPSGIPPEAFYAIAAIAIAAITAAVILIPKKQKSALFVEARSKS